MKKLVFSVIVCAVLILCTNRTTTAKLFVVEIDGEKIVLDYWVATEQAWQFSGAWPGLTPHPYEYKIWYPFLADAFDMTFEEQLEWIENLEYSGITDWRIGYFYDTIALKASMFGVLDPSGVNRVYNFNPDVYFPPASVSPRYDSTTGEWIGYSHTYHGRTGNELGDPDLGGNGAIIEAGGSFDFDDFDPGDDLDYSNWGTLIPGSTIEYYTLIPTHGQDHWAHQNLFDGSSTNIFDADINCSPNYLTYVIQRGEHPIGVWTVSAEAIPELWPPNHKFRTITISEAINPAVIDPETGEVLVPAGTLVPVTIVSVKQDEKVNSKGSGKTAPDAIMDYTDEAAVVKARAERDGKGTGRVYHICFTDSEGNAFRFKVGVPNNQGKNTILADEGSLYDSTVIAAP